MARTDELLSVEEAAAYLGVSVKCMYQLRWKNGGPVSWKQNRRLVYPRSQLDLYRARERERTLRGEGAV
ncbi:helix-turn-helix domain-containing protein [Mycolicibacterium sp. ELW1]|uniref:helix-turn-helix domain-containing protein n=1 Tax=Mycobacteriaceae TaxID=1762 RepID=UPI00143DBCA6